MKTDEDGKEVVVKETPVGNPRIFAIGDCNYGCVEPYARSGEWAGKGTMYQDPQGKPMKPLPKENGKPPKVERGEGQKPYMIPFGEWPIPPIPKISYPGEEQSIIACRNIEKIDHLLYSTRKTECCGHGLKCTNVKTCGCPPCQGCGTFCANMIGGSHMRVHDMHWPWGAGMFATSLGPDDACFVIAANWEKQSGCAVNWGQLASVQKEIIEASKVNEGRYGILGRLIWHFVHHTPVHLWGKGPRFGY